MMEKRAETNILKLLIFTIVTVVLFSCILYYISSSAGKSFIYEQVYAKQIALIIDNSKPEMAVSLDISKIAEIVGKKNVDLNKVFKIDNKEKKVTVSLSGSRGYSYYYFSDYDVAGKVTNDKLLVIQIKGNQND